MPVFRGAKNVVLQPQGAERAAVSAVYDHITREYVITLDQTDADTYREALLREGLHEEADENPADESPVDADLEDEE